MIGRPVIRALDTTLGVVPRDPRVEYTSRQPPTGTTERHSTPAPYPAPSHHRSTKPNLGAVVSCSGGSGWATPRWGDVPLVWRWDLR